MTRISGLHITASRTRTRATSPLTLPRQSDCTQRQLCRTRADEDDEDDEETRSEPPMGTVARAGAVSSPRTLTKTNRTAHENHRKTDRTRLIALIATTAWLFYSTGKSNKDNAFVEPELILFRLSQPSSMLSTSP